MTPSQCQLKQHDHYLFELKNCAKYFEKFLNKFSINQFWKFSKNNKIKSYFENRLFTINLFI